MERHKNINKKLFIDFVKNSIQPRNVYTYDNYMLIYNLGNTLSMYNHNANSDGNYYEEQDAFDGILDSEYIQVVHCIYIDTFLSFLNTAASYDLYIINGKKHKTYFTTKHKDLPSIQTYRIGCIQQKPDTLKVSLADYHMKISTVIYYIETGLYLTLWFTRSKINPNVYSKCTLFHLEVSGSLTVNERYCISLNFEQIYQILRNINTKHSKTLRRLLLLMYKHPLQISDEEKKLLYKYIGAHIIKDSLQPLYSSEDISIFFKQIGITPKLCKLAKKSNALPTVEKHYFTVMYHKDISDARAIRLQAIQHYLLHPTDIGKIKKYKYGITEDDILLLFDYDMMFYCAILNDKEFGEVYVYIQTDLYKQCRQMADKVVEKLTGMMKLMKLTKTEILKQFAVYYDKK